MDAISPEIDQLEIIRRRPFKAKYLRCKRALRARSSRPKAALSPQQSAQTWLAVVLRDTAQPRFVEAVVDVLQAPPQAQSR